MENDFTLSGRTLDLCPGDMASGIGLVLAPRGSDGAFGAPVRYGHVGVIFMPKA